MEKSIDGIFFMLKKADNQKYFFVIKSSKNEILMTSRFYDQKALAKLDIDLIRFNLRNTFVLDTTDFQ